MAANSSTSLEDARKPARSKEKIRIEPNRFLVLDSWRGLCALLVAVHNVNFGPWIPQRLFIAHSSLFVDFFFVLSGFVISHAYAMKLHGSSDAIAFMLRRFGRLWPLHITVLFWLVILHFARIGMADDASDAALSARTISTNLFFLQIFDVKSWLSWNAPSWSISAEFWTYLIFAVTCVLFSTARMRVLAFVVLAAFAAIVIFFQSDVFLETNTAYAFLRCLYGFSVGYLTYQAFRSTPARGGSILELSVVVLVVGYVTFTGNQIVSMIAPAIFGLSIWVFAQERGAVSRSMKLQPFVRLGDWSYSIYMVHWILRNFLLRANDIIENLIAHHSIPGYLSMREVPIRLTVITAYLIATVLLAAVTYRWIEQPGRRYFNRLRGASLDR
jgi:peptidoglycan/LPS O-acetylase OafA/YrhL